MPISRQSSKTNTNVSIPDIQEEQQFSASKNRASPNIKTIKRVRLKLEIRTCIEVTTKRRGMILMDPYQQLYTNTIRIVCSSIADVRSDKKPFGILVANFGDLTVDLLPHQEVSTAFMHQETFVESHPLHAELFGLIPRYMYTKIS